MATHDYAIADQSGLSFLSDLNNALAAIVSNNSSATEPSDTYPYMWWVDTTSNILKQRNAADDGWIEKISLAGTALETGNNLSDLASAATARTNLGLVIGADVQAYSGLLADVVTENSIGRKNAIINGNFDIWQRGTSLSGSSYTADRWVANEGNGSQTTSRQDFPLGQTDVPSEPEYFIRCNRSAVSSIASNPLLTRIEGVRSFAGQTVTLSFWAKVGASKSFNIVTAQNFGTGGSPSANLATDAGAIALTTAWQKFTFVLDIPSISGKTIGTDNNDFLHVAFQETEGFSTFTLDIAQVQLEKGSVATDFEQRPIGEELALCQRYYEKTNTEWLAAGLNDSSSLCSGVLMYKTKRAVPSFNVIGSNFSTVRGSPTFSSFDFLVPGFTSVRLRFNASGTPFTAGEGNIIRAANYLSNSIEIDAEL